MAFTRNNPKEAMAAYTIDILRKSADGVLTFKNGAINISATCWWDADVMVDAGTYTGYATRMSNKDDGTDGGNREAIWLGRQVPFNGEGGKSDGFFIHKGTGPSWSDGCIVLSAALVYQMWSSIQPKDSANISITIHDETVKRSSYVRHGCNFAY